MVDVDAAELAAARALYRAGRLVPRDRYRETRAPREVKGYRQESGDELVGYAYTPGAFVKSDATGRPLRHYVELPNGARVHPAELERLQRTPSGGWHMPSGESLRLLDRSGRVLSRPRSFFNAVSDAARYLRPAQLEPFAIESTDGHLRRTFTHAEADRLYFRWRDRQGRAGPDAPTFTEWAEHNDLRRNPSVKNPVSTYYVTFGRLPAQFPHVEQTVKVAIENAKAAERYARQAYPELAAAARSVRVRRGNPRASARPKKYTAFCEQCYSGGPPLNTDSIRAAERWCTSHSSMYGHRVAINRNTARNPGRMARAARALQRGQARWRARGEREYLRAMRASVRRGRGPGMLGRMEQTYYARQRRRRSNPNHGEWIDLVVPVVALFLLMRGRVVQVAS